MHVSLLSDCCGGSIRAFLVATALCSRVFFPHFMCACDAVTFFGVRIHEFAALIYLHFFSLASKRRYSDHKCAQHTSTLQPKVSAVATALNLLVKLLIVELLGCLSAC